MIVSINNFHLKLLTIIGKIKIKGECKKRENDDFREANGEKVERRRKAGNVELKMRFSLRRNLTKKIVQIKFVAGFRREFNENFEF